VAARYVSPGGPQFNQRPMIRAAGGVLLSIGLIAVVFASGGPKATVTDPRFHFEATLSGATVEHDFALKNLSSSPLRIQKVSMTPPLIVTSMPARQCGARWLGPNRNSAAPSL